jgi:hypothetical protein
MKRKRRKGLFCFAARNYDLRNNNNKKSAAFIKKSMQEEKKTNVYTPES